MNSFNPDYEILGVDAAKAALAEWDENTAILMVAIAGAESGWCTTIGGGSPRTLYTIKSSYANDALKYNCPLGDINGAAAWGLWQIFMPLHAQIRLNGTLYPSNESLLGKLGAPVDNPCQTAQWLCIPENNAKAAGEILKEQGFKAWSVYNGGQYRHYLKDAHRIINHVNND